MKKKHSLIYVATGLVCAGIMLSNVEAQTVLSGDHVVEGNLEVGTATQEGGLTIKGETGNTASPGIKVTGDGGVVFEGTSGVGSIPAEGAGVRMMWYPKKAAFRVGALTVASWMWNDENIGYNSVAFGDSMAETEHSVAMSGGETTLLGSHSTAMSGGGAYGKYSTAMSIAFASGFGSTAMSWGEALGSFSVAMGEGIAVGDYSTAMSRGVADGDYTTAIGNVKSVAFRSVVVGSYNEIDWNESAIEWVESDSIFVVGNGIDELHPNNALVIRKNGDFEMKGNVEMMAKVTMPRQGDILMGEFGNPEP